MGINLLILYLGIPAGLVGLKKQQGHVRIFLVLFSKWVFEGGLGGGLAPYPFLKIKKNEISKS